MERTETPVLPLRVGHVDWRSALATAHIYYSAAKEDCAVDAAGISLQKCKCLNDAGEKRCTS